MTDPDTTAARPPAPGVAFQIGDLFPGGSYNVIWANEETRQIRSAGRNRPGVDVVMAAHDLDTSVHDYGRAFYWPTPAEHGVRRGEFLPYVPDPWPEGGVPSTPEPVNQLPHLFEAEHGAFMAHACTFAHQIVDFNPTGYMLGDPENVDLAPLDPHTDASNKRTRVVLRYARALVGYIFRRVEKWEALAAPPSTAAAGGPQDWREGLARIRELDALICDTCGGGGNWLREFQHHMSDPDVWTWAMREVHDADTSAPYVRLPKIDKTNPASWVPSAENVTTPGGHLTALADQAFYKAMIGHFRRAFLRWDAEERVRM